jgi:low affinity Fe/Cu permease
VEYRERDVSENPLVTIESSTPESVKKIEGGNHEIQTRGETEE